MKNLTMGNMMKRDILEIYYRSLKRMMGSNGNVQICDVIEDAQRQHAPRFYISAAKAQWYISLMHRGMDLPVHIKTKVAMYDELYSRWLALGDESNHSIEVFEKLIEQPAPSFYVTKKTFRKLVYEALNERSLR